jgi:hypothetical protein
MSKNNILLFFALNLFLIFIIGILDLLNASYSSLVISYAIISCLNLVGFVATLKAQPDASFCERKTAETRKGPMDPEILSDLDSELERRKALRKIERN